MSAEQVRSPYASVSDRLAAARRTFGRGLTPTEKILEPHDTKAKPGKDV